jgi:hypothetical protein
MALSTYEIVCETVLETVNISFLQENVVVMYGKIMNLVYFGM